MGIAEPRAREGSGAPTSRARRRGVSLRACVSVCAVLLLLAAACKRGETEPQADEASPETPKPLELPALELREDTKNLLLTWVDDQGDFHVVEKVSDVPANGRAQVRVVVT